MALSFDQVVRTISDHRPSQQDPSGFARAASVAAVLAPTPGGTRVLLIRRAESPRDPWSGQMALPGGRHEHDDGSLRHTAVRETWEEVGLKLDDTHHIGALDDVEAIARGRRVGMLIRPHVFAVDRLPQLRPNEEVAETLWAPLGPLYTGAADTHYPWVYNGAQWKLPAWDVEGRVVWGLTHRMLTGMLELLR